MNDKVNIECPHCGYVVTLSLSDLRPGMWCQCFNCNQKIRFTARDIRHLMEAVRKRR